MNHFVCLAILFGALFSGSVGAAQKLNATIIGSGSPRYNPDRASASVLISKGNTRILVDMGNGTQVNLNKLRVSIRKLSALFFTHHHLDHNEEFVPLLIRSLMGRHNFTIIGPPNTVKLTETSIDLYAEDISYRLGKTKRTLADRKKAFSVRDVVGGETFEIDNIRISTLKVPHTIYTVAYRFDYKDQSIVITGDLTYTEDLPAFAKDANYMIIDSGGMIIKGSKRGRGKKKGKGKRKRVRAHLSLEESSKLAGKSKVENLVYTHFTRGEIDQEASLKVIRKNYSGNVIFGADLMELKDEGRSSSTKTSISYSIVDTGQNKFYSNNGEIKRLAMGDAFYGQDGNVSGNAPSYTDNKDGTITDNVSGLMWQKNMGKKVSFDDGLKSVKSFKLAGYNDWRIPTIKELYSLINFSGKALGHRVIDPFINIKYFDQPLGDTSKGERQIDAQTWSLTQYVGRTMRNDKTVFGVNFVDGRIKGYPKFDPRRRRPKQMYFRFVRGNESYGQNKFIDNKDETISDLATGLMWQKADSKYGMDWEQALAYCQKSSVAGKSDWHLPNAKALQSIVDYSRSVQISGSAAIDPIFQVTQIKDPNGNKQFPYFWSSTTHLDGRNPYDSAVYFAFGNSQGKMHGRLMDVHGAGSQRSDPKSGNKRDYPQYFGPQGDLRYVFNYVRCVR